ncbi:MAG: bifunctional DNA primase/polymerase [Gemmataceae bacterium]|nr:bifunctional DNA primase/polymerase [Gemmataceae bacterium]
MQEQTAVSASGGEGGWAAAGLAAGRECHEAALEYLALGLAPLPCCPPDHVGVGNHAQKCQSPGKAPLVAWKRYQAELPTAADLAGWWKHWPNANAYVALGPVSGVVRVDSDGGQGAAFLADLSGGDLPDTWEMETGSDGGRGLFYRIPDGFAPRVTHQHGDKLHEGLSLLGQGAGTVLPPSRHHTGRRYRWKDGRSPNDLPAAPMPPWLIHAMTGPARAGRGSGKRAARPDAAGEVIAADRNIHLASLAGTMRRRGMTRPEILAALKAVNRDRCKPPLDDAEVEDIADSISKYLPAEVGAAVVLLVARTASSRPETEPAGPVDTMDTPPRGEEPPPAGETHNSDAPAEAPAEGDAEGQPEAEARRGKGKKVKKAKAKKAKETKTNVGKPPRYYGKAVLGDKAELARLARLAVDDPAGFAEFRAGWRERGGSVRDLDRALADRVAVLLAARRAAADPGGEPPTYFEEAGRTLRNVRTDKGVVPVPLANFTARIVAEVTLDDGAERRKVFVVDGRLASGEPLPAVEVPADEFGEMFWVVEKWGTRAVVSAGAGCRDHLRAALQTLSGDVPRETVRTHTGWADVGGRPAYLSAGAVIGADGPVDGVRVHLDGPLARYALPPPPAGPRRRAAVRASLAPLIAGDLAADRILFPLRLATYRAFVGGANYAPALTGRTGAGKTELAARELQHFGPGMDAGHLPGSFTSTANALAEQAFRLKDALFVVDDFCPDADDPRRLRQTADRLVRGGANGAGRGRMNADGTLRPDKPPRSMVLVTGEDVAGGASLRARQLILDVASGAVNFAALTACQRDGADGLYAEAGAAWVRWLATDPDGYRAWLRQGAADHRAALAGAGGHSRVPTTAGDLLATLDLVLEFALEVGAVTRAEADDLRARGEAAVLAAAGDQAEHQRDADPAERFPDLVRSLLSSGRGHLVDRDGTRPANPAAAGWQHKGSGDFADWAAQGRKVGWLAGEHVFLDPAAALAEAAGLAADTGSPLTVTPRTLWRRLHEAGKLAAVETRGGKTRFAPRRVAEGLTREVLVLAHTTLFPPAGVPSVHPEGNGKPANGLPADTPPDTGHSGVPPGVHRSAGHKPPGGDRSGGGGRPPGRSGHSGVSIGHSKPAECPAASRDGAAGSGWDGHSGHSSAGEAHPGSETYSPGCRAADGGAGDADGGDTSFPYGANLAAGAACGPGGGGP